jgi:uncharacterized protein (DUF885 family)
MVSNKEFDKISQEMFYTVMEYNPSYGTFFGLHEYDDKMPSLTRETILKEIEEDKKYLHLFEEMDDSSLDAERKLDRRLAIDILQRQIFEQETLRRWEKDPDIANLIGGALFPLFARDFAPFTERATNMIKRLEQCPQILDDIKENITSPVKLWVEMAVESAQMLPLYFAVIEAAIEEESLKRRMKKISETLTTALKEYVEWLKTLIPEASENFAIGKENFDHLLELRHLWKREEILAFGEKMLEEEKKKLITLCKKIDPTKEWQDVVDAIKSESPESFEEALKYYRKETQRAREFVCDQDILTLPGNEELKIIETPEYLRNVIPFAALFSSAKFDAKQQSIYIVTPYEEKEMLKEHSYHSIINTSVHEAYPGHHVQLTCANTHDSYVRLLSRGTEFVEGWAHYCKEMMREKGFSQDPKVDVIRTMDIIWRACRILVDINLSCGEMGFDEAVQFLVENTGMKKNAVVAEVKRYTQTPSYALSYLLGKHMIKELKKEYRKKRGDAFSEKEFHDVMLYAGSLPIAYQREILLS